MLVRDARLSVAILAQASESRSRASLPQGKRYRVRSQAVICKMVSFSPPPSGTPPGSKTVRIVAIARGKRVAFPPEMHWRVPLDKERKAHQHTSDGPARGWLMFGGSSSSFLRGPSNLGIESPSFQAGSSRGEALAADVGEESRQKEIVHGRPMWYSSPPAMVSRTVRSAKRPDTRSAWSIRFAGRYLAWPL